MFNEKPLTGFGPGTYQFEYQAFQNVYEKTRISTTHGDRGNAHSEYLTYLSETGILGFLNYLLLTGFILGLGLKLIYRNPSGPERYLAMAALLGLATFMVHGLFNMFIDQDKIAILVFGSLAVLVSLDVYGGKGEKKLESGGGDMK
jgi:O-antigen ligase